MRPPPASGTLFPVPGTVLVGRNAELERVDAFLASAREDVHALAVTGPAGIGKTVVWQEGARRAAERGVLVLTARPSGGEVKLAFATVADLLGARRPGDAGRDSGAATSRTRERAARGRTSATRRSTAAPSRQGSCRCCASSRRRGRSSSRSTTRSGSTRPPRRRSHSRSGVWKRFPIGVLVSVRVEERTTRDLRAVRSRRPAGRAGDRRARRCRAARHVQAAARPGVPPARAREDRGCERRQSFLRPRDRAGARTHRCSPRRSAAARPEGSELARAGAVAAASRQRRSRRSLPPRACPGRTSRMVDAQALAAAEEAGLVTVGGDGVVRFSHPLVASAVYESAPAARRQRVHRALAGRVADPEEHARHLALAATGPDEETAQALDRAAELVGGRGAVAIAAELKGLAVRLTPPADGDSLARRRQELAERLYFAGDAVGGASRAGAARRHASGRRASRGDSARSRQRRVVAG